MNTMAVREMLNAQGRGRRVQDPVPRRLRRVPERDGRLRRPGAARHHLPRAARRDEHARPADLRVRRPGRFGARAGRAADRRVQAVPGGAGRAGVAPEVARPSPPPTARASSRTTPTSSSTSSRSRASASSWAGAARTAPSTCAARRTRSSGRCTRRTTASSSTTCRETMHYMRNWNREYLDFAKDKGWRQKNDAGAARALLATRCRRFRLAAQGKTAGPPAARAPARAHRHLLRPAAVLVSAARGRRHRPRRPIRSTRSRSGRWRCTTRGTRRTPGCARSTATTTCTSTRSPRSGAGIADGGWCWVESHWGKVRCMLRYSEAVEPGTVWTWNAIGKADGAWQLAPGADEARKGFLLNHLITDELPHGGGRTISNSDPVTGQAGWYDVRVRIVPAEPRAARRARRRSRRRRRRRACAARGSGCLLAGAASHDRLAEGPFRDAGDDRRRGDDRHRSRSVDDARASSSRW